MAMRPRGDIAFVWDCARVNLDAAGYIPDRSFCLFVLKIAKGTGISFGYMAVVSFGGFDLFSDSDQSIQVNFLFLRY